VPENAYLQVWLGILVLTDSSLSGWLVTNIGGASLHLVLGCLHAALHRLPATQQACGSVNFKGQFQTGYGHWCYSWTLSDAYSRYQLTCREWWRTTTGQVRQYSGWRMLTVMSYLKRRPCLSWISSRRDCLS
jgi:hypothetical protein